MRYLIDPAKKQYKANLHCHSVLSDGRKTPQELKKMYKEAGYSILAITDHERPTQHQQLSDADFLLLTGYECYIRPRAVYDAYEKEVHLNLFARDPANVKMICFDERYCRYLLRDNALDTVTPAGEPEQREFSVDYINHYIQTARENGYLVAYNHPYWSMEAEADILSYEGIFSLELCNYGSYIINHLEYAGALYDKMLTAGKRIFCHSADDNHNVFPPEHPEFDSFGAFTMIVPDSFTYSGVIDAMEKGQMYSSMGPQIYEVSVDENKVHIECSEAAHIFMYVGSKKPCRVHALPGQTLKSADFEIPADARYIRVSVQDAQGRWADSRGFFPDEFA